MLTKIQNGMKTNRNLAKVVGMAAMASLAVVFSCQEEEDPYATESSYVVEESVTDTYYEDADDMASVAVASEPGTVGGRVAGESSILTVNDDRFCAEVSVTVDITTVEPTWPTGVITIDFGTGCEDPRGNVRSGVIKISFEGPRFLPGSSVTIEFIDYTINGIILNGTRILTNVSNSTADLPKFQVQLEGSIEWPDGTIATRTHCFVRTWNRNGTPLIFADDQLIVAQCENSEEWPHDYAAAGTNRRGVEYQMVILVDLVYKRGCPIAVSGKKKFIQVSTGKEIIIDYGTGVCDRAVTIEIDGVVRTRTISRR
jgi:hypothetical protein